MPDDTPLAADTAETFDELAAFGPSTASDVAVRASLTELVERNPMTAVLAAAAAGAGLMALLGSMARGESGARAPAASAPAPACEAVPDRDDLATQLAQAWHTVRDDALDALDRIEPRASAALRAVRGNPTWTALAVGALGALAGSQWLRSGAATPGDATSDPAANA